MKLSEILSLNSGLSALSQRPDVPGSVSYPIAVNSRKIEPFVKSFNDARTKILEERAEKDDDGKAKIENGAYILSDEAAALAAINDLLDTEETVTLSKIKAEKLFGIDIAPAIMSVLMPMIEDAE